MRPMWSGYRVGKPDGGPKCEALERSIETYYGTPHARVFNSATSALHAALVAVGVRMGDEVVVPGLSMSASAACVVHAGAAPIFADIGDDYCLNLNDAYARAGRRTSAVVLVHLFGHHGEIPERFRSLPIVHDCAQSPTVRPDPALRGHIWCYSLNQHKIISCGEGGYAVTFDRRLADRMHAVRNHGECYTEDIVGWNYRMTEMEAAVALEEFAVLDKRIVERREWADRFGVRHGIRDIGNRDWFLYPARTDPDSRADLARRLGGRVGYHRPLYKLPYFAANGYADVVLPNVETIESELVVVDPLCS